MKSLGPNVATPAPHPRLPLFPVPDNKIWIRCPPSPRLRLSIFARCFGEQFHQKGCVCVCMMGGGGRGTAHRKESQEEEGDGKTELGGGKIRGLRKASNTHPAQPHSGPAQVSTWPWGMISSPGLGLQPRLLTIRRNSTRRRQRHGKENLGAKTLQCRVSVSRS